MTKYTSDYERFMVKVNKDPCGCWLWAAAQHKSSTQKYLVYGAFGYQGKKQTAHRVSWMLHNGPIPNGLYVCHSCDTPLCVNPEHLWLGTHKDNMKDAANKKRTVCNFKPLKGTKHPNARLTEKDALEIKHSPLKNVELAKLFKVSTSTISEIKSGRKWGHI